MFTKRKREIIGNYFIQKCIKNIMYSIVAALHLQCEDKILSRSHSQISEK